MAAMVTAAPAATTAETKPPHNNPFRTGDIVVHPPHRVGPIEGVGFAEITGYRIDLNRFCFADDQLALHVPLAQVRAVGVRKLAGPQRCLKLSPH